MSPPLQGKSEYDALRIPLQNPRGLVETSSHRVLHAAVFATKSIQGWPG